MTLFYNLKKQTAFFLMLSLVIGTASVARAEGTAGSAAPYLRNGVGARSLAMGNAGTAATEDASVSYWNPAAVTGLPVSNIVAQTSLLGWDRSMNYLAYALPIHKQDGNDFGFAFSWLSFSAGSDLEMRSNNYPEPQATFSDNQSVLVGTVASEFNSPLSFGASIKILDHKLQEEKASGLGVDLGLWQQATNEISWGLVVQDLFSSLKWGTGHTDKIPVLSRAGIEAELLNGYLLLAGDLSLTLGDDTQFGYHLGVEYWVFDTLGIRMGLNQGQLATGLGWSFMIPDFARVRLDYAFALERVTTSGHSHLFTLVLDFISKPKTGGNAE